MRDSWAAIDTRLRKAVLRMLQLYGKHFPILRGKMRIIRAVQRRIGVPDEPLLSRTRLGYSMMCSLDDWVQWQLFYFGDYVGEGRYARFLQQAVKAGDVAIDIGAHVGYYTLLFSLLVGESGLVWAFEPYPDSYTKLVNNIVLNQLKNVKAFNFALGSSEGTVQVAVQQAGNIGTARVVGEGEAEGLIGHIQRTLTLDSIVFQENPGMINWVKIDVEGYELEVLRGSVQTISAYRPTFLIEVNEDHLSKFGNSPLDLYDFMYQYGYRAYTVENDTLRCVQDGAQGNIIVFRHGERVA